MIVLDANVLIALLDADDAHHDAVESFLVGRLDDTFAASALTLAEALVRPATIGSAAHTERRLAAFGLRVIGLPPDAARELAEMRAATRLRMPDAVVVLTAEREGGSLATADAAVARVARARGLVVHAL